MLFRLSLLIMTVTAKVTTAQETVILAPELAKIIPKETMVLLGDNGIICFNWYWEQKDVLEAEERDRWGCPVTTCTRQTDKGRDCCVTHEVIRRIKKLRPRPDDHPCYGKWYNVIKPLNYFKMGLSEFTKTNNEQCMPEYLPDSDGCMQLENSLGINISWSTREPRRASFSFTSTSISNITSFSSPNIVTADPTLTTNTLSPLILILVFVIIIIIILISGGIFLVFLSRRKTDPSGHLSKSDTQNTKSLSFSTIKTVSSDATIPSEN